MLSKYLLSQPLHHTQELIENTNDLFVFSYFLLPSYELKMLLLGFGESLEIIEPISLKNEIQTTAKNLVKKYA